MSYQSDFISNLKYYRNLKGYSQAKLAEACNCQPGTIGCIECARQYPSFELLFKISDVLGVNPADLFLRNASNALFETRKIIENEFMPYLEKFLKEHF